MLSTPSQHTIDGSIGWQWDGVENKTSVAIYGVGAVVLLWLSSTIVSAVNSVPLVSARCSTGGSKQPLCLVFCIDDYAALLSLSPSRPDQVMNSKSCVAVFT